MAYKTEFQSNNADLQSILDMVNMLPDEPEPTEPIAVTISGTGESGRCYATIGGTTYTSEYDGDTSNISVIAGDVITFCVYSGKYIFLSEAAVEINGEKVAEASSVATPTTYEWTVPEGTTSIEIVLEYDFMDCGMVTVSTVSSGGENSDNSSEFSFVPTDSGGTTYKSKFGDNNIDLQKLLAMILALSGTIEITYNANGGAFANGLTNVVTYTKTEKYIASGIEEIPTRDKYMFFGWYLDTGCTDGNQFDLNNITSNIVVYAKWINTLIDFEYIENSDGTCTLTAWKGTLLGEPSTELVIPDENRIIL